MTERDIIIDTLKFWLYQIENGKCTAEEFKSIYESTIKSVETQATAKDIAEFYGQSEGNVRSFLSRKYIPEEHKPKRKVYYPFNFILKFIPPTWRKYKTQKTASE